MTDELHDMSVMAASERLKELAEKADDQIAGMEREDRLWETGEFRLVQSALGEKEERWKEIAEEEKRNQMPEEPDA